LSVGCGKGDYYWYLADLTETYFNDKESNQIAW